MESHANQLSKLCQRESWRECHKYECKIFAALPSALPNNVRAIIQLLLLHKAGVLPEGELDNFTNLESHIHEFESRGAKTWEDLCLMASAAQTYSKTTLSEDVVRRMFGIVSTSNSGLDTLIFFQRARERVSCRLTLS